MTSPLSGLRVQAQEIAPELVAWRRHLHRHPELSFQEVQTAQYVLAQLRDLIGLELSQPTPTSVMARLRGTSPGPCLALRADMDALPITEETGLAFTSENIGAMHACGHDGHTAMLLGAARLLSRRRNELRGEVRFLFQHAEESFPGGAQELVEKGVLDGVDWVLGQHLWLPLEAGYVGVAAGPLTAAPDTFDARITGHGGHAAQPHLAVDPIPAAAEAILALQQIASRRADPRDPVVVSVTRVHSGTADNVIPNEVAFGGTVRTYSEDLRREVPQWMERTLRGVAEAHGAQSSFRYVRGYRPVVNDPTLSDRVTAIFVEIFGHEKVVPAEPSMVGEDFSAYQSVVPGCFFWLGARNAGKGIVYPHHHSRFTIDEDVLPLGVAAMVGAALGLCC